MRTRTKLIILLALVLAALLPTTTALVASSYQIAWWTVDGGGGSSQSADGRYTLTGATGQPDVGFAAGGAYTLYSGFWHGSGVAIREWFIYLPLITRD